MPVEVELKYRADGPGPLGRLESAAAIGVAGLGPARGVDEVDRYLDTPHGRLAAAGWACRLRRREGSTRLSLKGPPAPGTADALHRRPELEGPADERLDPGGWPPSEARTFLDELRGDEALVERLRLVQRRTERPVALAGEVLGTLSLDYVRVEAGGRELGLLHVVELELATGAGAVEEKLAALDAALATTEGLEPDPRTKLEHALELIADR